MEGGGDFDDKKHVFKCSCRITYLLFLKKKKKCYKLCSLSNVSTMSFLIFYFIFRFYSACWRRHIMNHFILQIIWIWKFLSINWYNFGGYFASWCGCSSANLNFCYHWNLFKDIISPTWSSKITTFHLGQWYS